MATSSEELARLLNLNKDDSSALCEVLNDYMEETYESEAESESSDEEMTRDEIVYTALPDLESDNDDFLPVTPELAERIVPLDRGLATIPGPVDTATIIPTPCTCTFNDGKPCYLLFSSEDITDCQMQYAALERQELDIAILAKIQCGFHAESLTRSSKKSQQVQRKKSRLDYYHCGHKICRNLFMHIHRIGKDKLDALIAHFKVNGIEARRHKNIKRLPPMALKYEDTRRVVDFIINYAEVHAIQLPGRTPKHWITNVRLLPTHTTKKLLFDEYEKSCAESGYRIVKLRTFNKLWQQLVPFVRTMPPATDLCWTCQDATNKVTRAANKSDAIKIKLLEELKQHHSIVAQERLFYQQCIARVKNQLPQGITIGRHDNCSFDGINHLSFDFAQQLHYPYNPLQPGPIFFKTPRKCGLFGINCEALSKQVNYIIDEAHACGKGANTVISYLHHYLETFSLGEKHLILHADNCGGQNKNSFMVWYLLWRCLTGRHESIKLCFLITGHTKFSPDAGFGLIKRKFRKAKVDCLKDIEHIVNVSSEMNSSQIVGSENGESDVLVHNWSGFLGTYFNKVKKIKQNHQLDMDSSGLLQLKLHSEAEAETQHLIKQRPSSSDFPPVVPRNGLPLQRQWYLYNEIRPFVSEDQQDIVTPKPITTEPEPSTSTEHEEEEEVPPPKQRKRALSTRGRGGKRGRSA